MSLATAAKKQALAKATELGLAVPSRASLDTLNALINEHDAKWVNPLIELQAEQERKREAAAFAKEQQREAKRAEQQRQREATALAKQQELEAKLAAKAAKEAELAQQAEQEAYLLQVAERISYWIKSEGMAYGVETAQRNGVRYILLPGVEQWEVVRKNMSGRGQLEAFRTILRREFQWTSKKLDEVCASIREHGEWSPLPYVSEEVKYYERVCLSAYALSQVGKGIDYQRTK